MSEHKHVAATRKDAVKKVVDDAKIPNSGSAQHGTASARNKRQTQTKRQSRVAMTNRRLLKIAFAEAAKKKPGIESLLPHCKGMPALLFTKENPFSLFKLIKANKSPAPAKPGQKAPTDLKILAGPTPFAPGPVISELAALGLKTKVDAGKINIVADAIVCKEGAVISDKLALYYDWA